MKVFIKIIFLKDGLSRRLLRSTLLEILLANFDNTKLLAV